MNLSRVIVFCHANGYPAGTCRMLLDAWRDAGWAVLAPDHVGHDLRYPVSSNGPHLRDELLDVLRVHAAGRPVQVVGHSLGGFLVLMAACHEPDRVSGLVLLDSPVIGGWRAHSVQVMKATGLLGSVSPGRVSRTRRDRWPSADAVHAHFAAKAVFAPWNPRVLADYVAAGTEPDPEADAAGSVRLVFRRDVETRIYDTLPHHLDRLLRRRPPGCPVVFIGGTQSAEVRQAGLASTRQLARGRLRWLQGTHLYPMEHPDATAAAVLDELAAMNTQREAA